jgi:hypothetical protein
MKEKIIQERIVEEIKFIPQKKLIELYDIVQ